MRRCARTRRSCGKRACVPFHCSARPPAARQKMTAILTLLQVRPGCPDGPPPADCAGAAHRRVAWASGGPLPQPVKKRRALRIVRPGFWRASKTSRNFDDLSSPPKNWLYFNSARRLWDGRLKSTHLQNHASMCHEFARQARLPGSDFSLLRRIRSSLIWPKKSLGRCLVRTGKIARNNAARHRSMKKPRSNKPQRCQ